MRLVEEQYLSRRSKDEPEILVVGGGKGGVGKTCFAVNMSVEIARKGWRVVIVDADLGCSNVEAVLGTRSPVNLDEFFWQSGERKKLDNVLYETQYENLKLIPGASGLIDVANPKYQQKMAFIRELKRLEADLVIIDLDAGTHLNTLDFFLLTDTNGVLVITPEKTSIDNAFKFLRAVLFRRIARFYSCPEIATLLKRNETLSQLVETVKETELFEDDVKIQICSELEALARSIRPRIVVNKATNSYEAQIAANILSKHARQDLMVEPENLGFIYFDKCVSDTVNSGVPYIVSHPRLKISTCITNIANRLGYV